MSTDDPPHAIPPDMPDDEALAKIKRDTGLDGVGAEQVLSWMRDPIGDIHDLNEDGTDRESP